MYCYIVKTGEITRHFEGNLKGYFEAITFCKLAMISQNVIIKAHLR